MKRNVTGGLLALLGALAAGHAARGGPAEPSIIPWPQSIEMARGAMPLTGAGRIVVADARLAPLARVLAGELRNVTGLEPAVAEGDAKAGDITLAFDPAQKTGGYQLAVGDRADIKARDYKGAAAGTVTILQALDVTTRGVALPRMTVADHPHADYCAAMLDVARQGHTVEQLRDCIDACRFYKIRYFALHLTDDQRWTFPSTAYPQLGTKNGGAHGGLAPPRYSVEEMKGLVAYADERGVTLVPEIEMPGHCGAAERALPEVFGGRDPKTGKPVTFGVMNIANENLYAALDTILGEVAGIFASSPYIHLGGDETWFGGLEANPDVRAYMKQKGMKTDDLFRYFLDRMGKTVNKLGKRAIVWEGFEEGGNVKVSTNVIVMAWRNWYYRADRLVRDGYTIINCPWWLGCDWDDWNMYMSNFIWLKPADPVLGATSVYWEQPGDTALSTLRHDRLPWRNERTWNIDTRRKRDDLKRRLRHTDLVLDRLLCRFTFAAQGLQDPDGAAFEQRLKLEFLPSVKGDAIRYTLSPASRGSSAAASGDEPTAASPACEGPITLTDSTRVKARAFDAAGKPLARTWERSFEYQPFAVKADGLISKAFGNRFAQKVTLAFQPHASGGVIRYTLDPPSQGSSAAAGGKEPGTNAPAYGKPITFDKSTTVRARYFDAAGKPRGYLFSARYPRVDYENNLTTRKPVTTSSCGWQEKNEYAVDGLVEVADFESTFWGAGPAPQWLQVDLEKPAELGEARLFTFFGDGRYYQYVIETSPDGKSWTKVADGAGNTTPATEKGYRHTFAPVKARYVKVTMLKNSANEGQHIVELRVYPPGTK